MTRTKERLELVTDFDSLRPEIVYVDCQRCGQRHRTMLVSQAAFHAGDRSGRCWVCLPGYPCVPEGCGSVVSEFAVEERRIYRVVDELADPVVVERELEVAR